MTKFSTHFTQLYKNTTEGWTWISVNHSISNKVQSPKYNHSSSFHICTWAHRFWETAGEKRRRTEEGRRRPLEGGAILLLLLLPAPGVFLLRASGVTNSFGRKIHACTKLVKATPARPAAATTHPPGSSGLKPLHEAPRDRLELPSPATECPGIQL